MVRALAGDSTITSGLAIGATLTPRPGRLSNRALTRTYIRAIYICHEHHVRKPPPRRPSTWPSSSPSSTPRPPDPATATPPSRAAPDGPLAVAVADLDRFQQVNDALGFEAGDRVLTAFERTLSGSLPADAVIARISGDEYAIALPGTSAESALIQLEEVRTHYAAHGVDGGRRAARRVVRHRRPPAARGGHRRRAPVRGRGADARQARGGGPQRHLRRGEDDDEEQLLLPRHARPARQAVGAPRAARRRACCARRSTTCSPSTARGCDHGRLEAWTSPQPRLRPRAPPGRARHPEARRPPAAVQHRCTRSATTASIRISITADRAKYKNLARDPRASLHVTREDFFAYVVLEGDVELSAVAAAPDDATVDELVDVYRAMGGEHDDWDDYRARDGRRPPRRRPPRARPTPTACCPADRLSRAPTRPATDHALGGRPLSQATGRWDRGARPATVLDPCGRRSVAGGLRRPSGGAGQLSCCPDGRHDLAGTIAERVPGEAEDDPAFEDELVLPWAVPLEDVAALVVSAIELDGDLQLRVGQVDLRELPSARIMDAVVDDRFRQPVLDQQRRAPEARSRCL